MEPYVVGNVSPPTTLTKCNQISRDRSATPHLDKALHSNDLSSPEHTVTAPRLTSTDDVIVSNFDAPVESIIPSVEMREGDERMPIDVKEDYDQGLMYFEGKGVPQDYVKAKEYFVSAAHQGHQDAQNKLGFIYNYGKGVPQDFYIAAGWYFKAASQGYAKSQCNLGFLYDSGQGVKQDYAKAIDWYMRAARQGNSKAQCHLGLMFENGKGVPKDYYSAFDWYQKSARQGNSKAQCNLGFLYES
ncbi:hypothetical protein BGX20_006117, partial [Mortierella sp. AD010]